MKSDQRMGESCHIKGNRLYLGRGRRALQKPPVAAWSDVLPCSPERRCPAVSPGLVTMSHPGKCTISVCTEVEGPTEPKVCQILSWCYCSHEILGRRQEYVGAPWGHAVVAHCIYCTRSTRYSQLTTEALACRFILQSFYFFLTLKCIKSTKQLSFYDTVISVVIQALDDQVLRGGGV